ncbi:unnamed protein product [Dovyalis caffra]|uniref:Uncharacterized protein n=1 Tax=Dovyalis caffra TaxID=77055 RepID=A0AAV1RA87_9ROSI|nr:unnamed protein product [Dovyalis caffra]
MESNQYSCQTDYLFYYYSRLLVSRTVANHMGCIDIRDIWTWAVLRGHHVAHDRISDPKLTELYLRIDDSTRFRQLCIDNAPCAHHVAIRFPGSSQERHVLLCVREAYRAVNGHE